MILAHIYIWRAKTLAKTTWLITRIYPLKFPLQKNPTKQNKNPKTPNPTSPPPKPPPPTMQVFHLVFQKDNHKNRKVYPGQNVLCLPRKGRERDDEGNLQSKGVICPVSLSKQKEIFSCTLGKPTVLHLSAAKRLVVYTTKRRLANTRPPHAVIWRNRDITAQDSTLPKSKQQWHLHIELLNKYHQKLSLFYHFFKGK